MSRDVESTIATNIPTALLKPKPIPAASAVESSDSASSWCLATIEFHTSVGAGKLYLLI